jgi:replication-associated recombination protein RarA
VVVTDPNDWGGWRVPGAEYDRDPYKIEFQARLITNSPKLMRLAQQMVEAVHEAAGEAPPEMVRLAEIAAEILDEIKNPDAPPKLADGATEVQAHAAE